MWWSVTLSLVAVLVASLYLYCRKRYQYFTERGVRSLTPVPPIGFFWKSAFFKQHLLEDLREGYNAYPNEKFVGAFEGLSPVVLIRDPDIIKKITVKDFDHFVDHRSFLFGDNDPMLKDTVLFLRGQKWKHMLATLSPAFTGSKMKLMVPFIQDISNHVVQYLHDEVKVGENGNKATEAKELYKLFTRYTKDVIASCAVGCKADSFRDETNDFYSMGCLITDFNKLKALIMTLFPRLCTVLGMELFPAKATGFFQKLVSDAMNYRKDNNVTRPNMIQLLMEAKSGILKIAPTPKADEVVRIRRFQSFRSQFFKTT